MADYIELLESALDNLPEGAAIAAGDGTVAFWNCGAEAITGWLRGEVVGKNVREMLEKLVVGGADLWKRQTDAQVATARGAAVCRWRYSG